MRQNHTPAKTRILPNGIRPQPPEKKRIFNPRWNELMKRKPAIKKEATRQQPIKKIIAQPFPGEIRRKTTK